MFAAQRNGNGNGKGKQSSKNGGGGDSGSTNRDTCQPCKAAKRKSRHKEEQCWILHPHLKPEKFMTPEEKKAKAAMGSQQPHW